MSAPIEEVFVLSEEASEDKELVLAFKRGEDGSYQAIYDRHAARIRGICRRMLDHSHDAEEAQQETFMRVFTGLPNFNGRYQLGAWVSRIATNVCLDHIRSKGRKPADSTDNATLVDISADSADGPEEIFMQGDERQRVRDVLSELAPMHRAALALREFEGMSYADIAVALGMTEPQVKALIHRARRSFKKRWAHGLALLLPWRLLARLRRFSSHYDAPHLGDAAASTANLASSCSAAFQQCGAFVTDKIATTMTAVLVGTAAVGVAVAPGSHATQRGPARVAVVGPSTQDVVVAVVKHQREKKKDVPATREPAPTVADTEPDPEPQPQSSATPAPEEPAPAQSAPPADGASPANPPANAAPAPLYTFFGWESAQPVPRAQAASHTHRIDCGARSVTHQVDTWIAYGAFSYRALFSFYATATAGRVEFIVWKDGHEVRYSSWGAEPVAVWTVSATESRLEITGDYGALYGFDPNAAKLPKSGSFHATLTVDCSAQTVVTEGATFTTE